MAENVQKQTLDTPVVEVIPLTDYLIPKSEQSVLQRWDEDIQRAAHHRASGACSGGADADDFAQEARIQVLSLARVAPQAPVQYVRTVIANAVHGAVRRELRSRPRRSLSLEDLGEILPAPTPPDAEGELDTVAQWASRLPRRLRGVYKLLYAEDRTQRDAAKILGVSQPRIAQLHRKLLDIGRAELMNPAS